MRLLTTIQVLPATKEAPESDDLQQPMSVRERLAAIKDHSNKDKPVGQMVILDLSTEAGQKAFWQIVRNANVSISILRRLAEQRLELGRSVYAQVTTRSLCIVTIRQMVFPSCLTRSGQCLPGESAL